MSNKGSIVDLLNELQLACRNQEWDQVAEFDSRLKQSLEFFVSKVSNDAQKEKLQAILAQVQRIYALAIDDAEKHRDEIGQELQKLSRDSKAVNSYLDSAGY